MPALCCGRASDVVEKSNKKPSKKKANEDDDENNNEDTSRESEVADSSQYTEETSGQSNGLLKGSPRRQKYEVNRDPEAQLGSTPQAAKKGRKLPKKKGSVSAETEGDESSEKVSQLSTPAKGKSSKKSSFKQPEEMEMSPLDPGFFNTNTVQAARQLYAQQTFEEEDDDVLENVEEERRKNKQRQRQKKKHGQAAQTPRVDPTEAAYERAQQEIDKVLGPRQGHHPSSSTDTGTVDRHRGRSKRRGKKGQVNDGYSGEGEAPGPSGLAMTGGQGSSESIEDMKSRVHALLDDAFSLLSNSYTSIGNRVAPDDSIQRDHATAVEARPLQARSGGAMPEVEEVRERGFAPKPGEKLHIPLRVERAHADYDHDGLISWSPYRASDESARIVLPEAQNQDPKAAAQEKVHTTTFTDLAAGSNSGSAPSRSNGYYATQPGQPIVINTRKLDAHPGARPTAAAASSSSSRPQQQQNHRENRNDPPYHYKSKGGNRGSENGSSHSLNREGGGGEGGEEEEDAYTPYPGLEAYEQMLSENTATTTALYTAAPTAQRRGSATVPSGVTGGGGGGGGGGDSRERQTSSSGLTNGGHHPRDRDINTKDEEVKKSLASSSSSSAVRSRKDVNGDDDDENHDHDDDDQKLGSRTSSQVKAHQPPSRNVGTTDERDVIAASVQAGASPKDLVDSIRRELQTMTGKLPPSPPPASAAATNGGGGGDLTNGDAKRQQRGGIAANGESNGGVGVGVGGSSNGRIGTAGVAGRESKPVKKPRKSSYLDSN